MVVGGAGFGFAILTFVCVCIFHVHPYRMELAFAWDEVVILPPMFRLVHSLVALMKLLHGRRADGDRDIFLREAHLLIDVSCLEGQGLQIEEHRETEGGIFGDCPHDLRVCDGLALAGACHVGDEAGRCEIRERVLRFAGSFELVRSAILPLERSRTAATEEMIVVSAVATVDEAAEREGFACRFRDTEQVLDQGLVELPFVLAFVKIGVGVRNALLLAFCAADLRGKGVVPEHECGTAIDERQADGRKFHELFDERQLAFKLCSRRFQSIQISLRLVESVQLERRERPTLLETGFLVAPARLKATEHFGKARSMIEAKH